MPLVTQTPKTSHTYLNKSRLQIKQVSEEWSFTEREPWFLFFKLQEQVFQLFLVNIRPKQMWTTVTFLLFTTTPCPILPLPSHHSVTHSGMPKSNAISMEPS